MFKRSLKPKSGVKACLVGAPNLVHIELKRKIVIGVVGLATLVFSACGKQDDAAVLQTAKAALEKGDNKSAVIGFKILLQSKSDSGEVRYLLGKALLAEGNSVAAILEFNKAVALGYSVDNIAPEMARALLQNGEDVKVIELYSVSKLEGRTAAADIKTSLATALLRTGMREQASRTINEALALSTKYVPALIIKARILASERDFVSALAAIEEALKVNPQSYLAWQVKGDVSLFGLGDKDTGIAAYRKAVEIEPRFLAGHAAIIATLMKEQGAVGVSTQISALKKALPQHPYAVFFEAQLALLEKDFHKARELTQQLLRILPENVQVLQLAGVLEVQSGRLMQSETYLAKGLHLRPQDPYTRRLLAEVYLRTGQADKALSVLTPILTGTGDDAASLALAGEAEVIKSNTIAAERYFVRAEKLAPADPRIRTAAALARAGRGGPDVMFQELESISSADTGTVADMALISARMRIKDYDGALRGIDALERKRPGTALPHNLRGRVLMAKLDNAGARVSFERALKVEPSFFPAASGLAALDIAEGKPELARENFEAILKVDPKNVPAMLAIAQLKSTSEAARAEVERLIRDAIVVSPTDVSARLMLSRQLMSQRRFKDAVTAAQEAVTAVPDNPRLILALGNAQLTSGDSQQAVSSYSRLVALNPKSPEPHLQLAAVHLRLKNNTAAAQSYRRALELSTNLPLAQASLIALTLEEGRLDQARQLSRLLQKQQNTNPAGWVYEGDIEFSQKNFGAASAAYKIALSRQKVADIAVKLHRAYLAGEQHELAARLVAEWDRTVPRDPAFQMYLGDEAMTRGDFSAAEARYRGAILAQPRNALAFNNLSYVLLMQSKGGAVNAAEKANELMPGSATLMDTLAVALASEQKFDRAIALQKKAVELAAGNPVLRLSLAKIYIQSGKNGEANNELASLAALGGSYSGQSEVNRLIQSLK